MIVFDSSALLALVRAERGGEAVRDLLDDADVPKFVHAANLCEVLHQLWRSDGQDFAEEAVRDVLRASVIERRDMDGAFWRDAGALIAARRLAGTSLALGDALGVALARRLDAEFVTADRAEIEPLRATGEVRAIYIR